MALAAETVQTRVRNLRADALTAAKAARTHARRIDASLDNVLSAVSDLEMFAANRKADRSPEEVALDDKLFALAVKAEAGEDILADVLDLINEVDPPAAEAPAAEAPAEAPAKPSRKVKDAPQA